MRVQCKTCKKYKGDCGCHFRDELGHTDYDIPSEGACDIYGNCMSFEETRTECQIALDQLEEYEDEIATYIDTNILRKALKIGIKNGY